MSEFVCEVAPDEFGKLTEVASLGEEIVRCRDCRYMVVDDCGTARCLRDVVNMRIEPNGYCAWAVRK